MVKEYTHAFSHTMYWHKFNCLLKFNYYADRDGANSHTDAMQKKNML